MAAKNISIAGAGLVGSLLAVFMAKKGHKVQVFERRPDMRKETISAGRSINLALSERGWTALRLAGLDKLIEPIAIPMHGRYIHLADGNTAFQPYGRQGECIYSVSRALLNKELMTAAEAYEGVEFHFNQRFQQVEFDASKAIIEDLDTGKTQEQSFDLLFGSDGAFSAVRYSMQKFDRFNYSQHYIEHGYKELCIPATEEGLWKLEKNALHIWPRNTYMLIALPNTDGSFTCTLFLDFEGSNDSLVELNTEQKVKDFFLAHFPDVLDLIPDLVQQFLSNPTSSLVTVKCYPWAYKDRSVLIGDAAHAIIPFFGQGMNAGFEDCVVLEGLIKKHKEDWATILQEFQQARKANADAIADLAYENFVEMRDKVADPKFLLRKKIEKMISEMYPDHYIPKYSMVSFTNKPYTEALRVGKEQDAFFERVMQLQGIEENWNSSEVVALMDIWLKEANFFAKAEALIER